VAERVVDECRLAAASRPSDVEARDVAPPRAVARLLEKLEASSVARVRFRVVESDFTGGSSSSDSLCDESEATSTIDRRDAPRPRAFHSGVCFAAVSNCFSLRASSELHVTGAVLELDELAEGAWLVLLAALDVELEVERALNKTVRFTTTGVQSVHRKT